MWQVIDIIDASDNTGKRIIYTVKVEENEFVDVMNCVDQDNLFYAMELDDAKIVYDETGNSTDFPVKEKDIIAFVKKFVLMKESFESFVKEKITERGDTDLVINNVRVLDHNALVACVSYTWRLNGWEHRARHEEFIAVFKDGKWHSPHIW